MRPADHDRMLDLRRIAEAGWHRWFRRYRLTEQLNAIRELGESGSGEALAYLKHLVDPTVRIEWRSENDGFNNGIDATFYDAKCECVSFPNAKGELCRSLHYEVRLNSPYGECTVEEIQTARDRILSNDPHRTIANAISDLENSLGARATPTQSQN